MLVSTKPSRHICRVGFLYTLVLPVVMGCQFSFSVGDRKTHGPAPESPELVITAPAKHVVSLATKYYIFEGNSSKWHSRTWRETMPASGEKTIQLEPGHDGYYVELLVPASVQVTATLMSDGQEIKLEKTLSGGTLVLKAGTTSKEDEPIAKDVRLNVDDRNRIAKVLDAFKSRDTTEVISDGDESLVDSTILHLLSDTVQQQLGDMGSPNLKEWATWETSNEGTRYYGMLIFERGTAFVGIVLRDKKVVGFDFDSEQLIQNWLKKPTKSEPYRRQGEQMLREMLSKDIDAAYQNLDPIYHEQVSQDKLASVADKMRTIEASQIESVTVVDETFERKPESDAFAYSIVYQVAVSDDSKIVLRVPFELSVEGDSKIGRLSGFYVVSDDGDDKPKLAKSGQPTNRSTSGETAKKGSELSWIDRQKHLVVELIGHMAGNDVDSFLKALHKDAQLLVDLENLKSELSRISSRLGPAIKADWKTVEVKGHNEGLGEGSSFEGTFNFENGGAWCRVQYADFHPVGVAVKSEGFSSDTFSAVDPPDGFVNHAQKFWTSIFQGNGETAYRLMIPEGKDNLFPLETFLNLVKQAKLPDGVMVRTVHLNEVRLFDKPQSGGINLSIYKLLERSDDRYATCRLRYSIEKDGDFQLTNFDTGQFDDGYPISDFRLQQKFFTAMSSGDHQQVLALIHPFDVGSIHRPTFAAFAEQFAETTGKFKAIHPHELSAARSYDKSGNQRTDAAGIVEFEKRRVELSCNHAYGLLEGFNFQDPEGFLEGFAERIKDTSAFEQRGENWMREMLSGDVDKAMKMLMPSFYKEIEPKLAAIKKARSEFLAETGKLKSIKPSGKKYDKENQLWQMNYEMEFERDTGTGNVQFQCTAFNAGIFGFYYTRSKAEGKPLEINRDNSEIEKTQPDKK